MRENFLHYIWRYQKFIHQNLQTNCGEKLMIVDPGEYNHDSGPDFFNGKIRINGQLWAGNVEIHLKSSSWYEHRHHNDPAYDNVILHVVWEEDTIVRRQNGSIIHCLSLKDRVEPHLLNHYYSLFHQKNKWINCDNRFIQIQNDQINAWLVSLFEQRLHNKMRVMERLLKQTNNHWEEVLFRLLARYFGSGLNADAFQSMASNIDFRIINRLKHNPGLMEALFFGRSGLLEDNSENQYLDELKQSFLFLMKKFNLDQNNEFKLRFFRLRPASFPTIRLSQLARLYASRQGLFSLLMKTDTIKDLYKIFSVRASEFWDNHYRFDVHSSYRPKTLSTAFINGLIINVVIPLKCVYHKSNGRSYLEKAIEMMEKIPVESNKITTGFKFLGDNLKHAYDSQIRLQLYNNYCMRNKCLECAIGNAILNRNM